MVLATRPRHSIIIPVLNESRRIVGLLTELKSNVSGEDVEVIVVDGGSDDDTQQLVLDQSIVVVDSRRGRAAQQNAGALAASGDILVFLHADTMLPPHALSMISAALDGSKHAWGRFDVAFDSTDRQMRMIAFMMNWRSRISGIATGDQCIFVRKSIFAAVGGFPDQALMEDIEISNRLKRFSSPVCLRAKVCTSARRWETQGIFRTIALMWWLRFAYWLGVSPATLARWYGYGKSEASR